MEVEIIDINGDVVAFENLSGIDNPITLPAVVVDNTNGALLVAVSWKESYFDNPTPNPIDNIIVTHNDSPLNQIYYNRNESIILKVFLINGANINDSPVIVKFTNSTNQNINVTGAAICYSLSNVHLTEPIKAQSESTDIGFTIGSSLEFYKADDKMIDFVLIDNQAFSAGNTTYTIGSNTEQLVSYYGDSGSSSILSTSYLKPNVDDVPNYMIWGVDYASYYIQVMFDVQVKSDAIPNSMKTLII